MSRFSTKRVLLFGLVILTLVLSSCTPAATTEAPQPEPAQPTEAATEEMTEAPVMTEEPTEEMTEVATEEPTEEATEAVEPTMPPEATPTTPPPVCEPLATQPTVNAGDLGSPENPIVMTFVPSGDTGRITTAGEAIADCLTEMTGMAFEIEVGTSFAASIEAMGAEQAQVGFLNTFSVLLAREKYNVVPVLVNTRRYNTNTVDPDQDMAGEMQPFYKGQFITQADSGITELADLAGKSFCFVDPNSTSGYIIPRIIMQANGIDPDLDLTNQVSAGSHNNVAIAVYQGDCDAGVTFIDVLTDEAANLQGTYPDIAEKVVPFAVTDRIPNDGVQVIENLDPAITEAVVDGMLAMAEDPGGAAVLRSLYSINGFAEVEPDFYDDFAQVLSDAGVNPEELVQ